jgi:hypothetical protein
MTRWDLISRSIRISAAEFALADAEERLRTKRARQHRFQESALVLVSPMTRARSGSEQTD